MRPKGSGGNRQQQRAELELGLELVLTLAPAAPASFTGQAVRPGEKDDKELVQPMDVARGLGAGQPAWTATGP